MQQKKKEISKDEEGGRTAVRHMQGVGNMGNVEVDVYVDGYSTQIEDK